MRELTSGQVERKKRSVQATAQLSMLVGVVAFGVLMLGTSINQWVACSLIAVMLVAAPVAIVAQLVAFKLGRMAGFFNEGLCPFCAARVVESWRIIGRGVRCPECGLGEGVDEPACRACGYDLQGCPTLECEPVKRMECGLCRSIYVQEEA